MFSYLCARKVALGNLRTSSHCPRLPFLCRRRIKRVRKISEDVSFRSFRKSLECDNERPTNNRTMDIGRRIYEVMCEKGYTAAWLAQRVPCERSNIYNVFRRKSMSIDLLFIFSTLLQHDFFAELSQDWQRQISEENTDAPEKITQCG